MESQERTAVTSVTSVDDEGIGIDGLPLYLVLWAHLSKQEFSRCSTMMTHDAAPPPSILYRLTQ